MNLDFASNGRIPRNESSRISRNPALDCISMPNVHTMVRMFSPMRVRFGVTMGRKKSNPPVRYALVDCDPGVDDALALAMGFASPFFRYDAVTTVHGNVSARLAYRNARRLTAFLRGHLKKPIPEVPVYPGASLALDGSRLNRSESRAIHGPEGMGVMFNNKKRLRPLGRRSSKPAWELIVEQAAERGSALTIITLGPLTNLALALRRAPNVFSRVKRIVIMGGAARMPGNVTPTAEFNIYCDPLAAKEVFSSGLPITMVGLDVTNRALLSVDEFKGGGSFRAALRDLIKVYLRFAKNGGGPRTSPCTIRWPSPLR